MRPDDWHRIDDLDTFLARAGDFLCSRPSLHTVLLTVTETLRTRGPYAYGTEAPVFGVLEEAGEARAAYFRTPPHRLYLSPLTSGEADALAGHLTALDTPVPGVTAQRSTAAAFAEAWQRHTGATPGLDKRQRLHRLGTLTPPQPQPEGRSRVAAAQDRGQLAQWYEEFCATVGEPAPRDAASWADARIRSRRVMLWETADGAPVSMAARTPKVAGQIRVAPVYTPAHLRGRGYAGAVTSAVSRAALADGASQVLLFTDLANPTSNGLYRRIGYRPVADFAVYDF